MTRRWLLSSDAVLLVRPFVLHFWLLSAQSPLPPDPGTATCSDAGPRLNILLDHLQKCAGMCEEYAYFGLGSAIKVKGTVENKYRGNMHSYVARCRCNELFETTQAQIVVMPIFRSTWCVLSERPYRHGIRNHFYRLAKTPLTADWCFGVFLHSLLGCDVTPRAAAFSTHGKCLISAPLSLSCASVCAETPSQAARPPTAA